ncbi:transporter substrate-binding protein [Brevibacillus sp. NRS-1366]|uniref:substrate-binding protein n=1 Tax=Brevibacillus sp. NRS-1366 TaxID=3233899 RepID=UPI003D215274
MKKVLFSIISILLVFTVSACGSIENKETVRNEEQSGGSDTIKVGMLTALSGVGSNYGIPTKNSAQLAVNEINDSGGLLGKKLELVVGDSGSDPKTASDSAKALLNKNKVDVLFAATNSAERNAILPVAEKTDQLFFYTVLYEGGAYSKNMFINGEVPDQQVVPVYPYMMEQYKGKKWFIVGSDYVWPRKTSEVVNEVVKKANGEVVGEEYLPLGTSNFTSIVSKIQSTKPDFISLELIGSDLIAFMKQFHGMGLHETVKVIALSGDENVVDALGKDGVGMFISAAYFYDMDTPENKRFLEAYFKANGKDAPKPNFTNVPSYDAVHLWAKAVEKANTLESEKVKEFLTKVSFNGPRGEVSYEEESRHATLPIFLGEVQRDGKIKMVKDFGKIPPGNQRK